MSYYSDRKHKMSSIYMTPTLKRTKYRVDFLSNHSYSKPRKRDSNTEQQMEEFTERYCYLYENAPVILYFMVNNLNDEEFSEEVKKRTGFDFRDKNFVMSRNSKDINDFLLLEDIVLGDDYDCGNVLKTSVLILRNCSSISESFDKEFDFSSNIGIGKYDLCMKLLLDIVYSFINIQSFFPTNLCQKTQFGYKVLEHVTGKSLQLDSYEVDFKLRGLGCYYNILGYRNNISGNVVLERERLDYGFPTGKTLVNANNFVGTLLSLDKTSSTVRILGNMIYFRLHDEMPWHHNCFCCNHSGVEDGCGTEFYVKEEDIFYKDGKFRVMCPGCGAICTTSVWNDSFQDKIEERIKKRSIDDKYLDRKIEILSELHSIGAIEVADGKRKIKI